MYDGMSRILIFLFLKIFHVHNQITYVDEIKSVQWNRILFHAKNLIMFECVCIC